MSRVSLALRLAISVVVVQPCLAVDSEHTNIYTRQIRPIMNAHCLRCHATDTQDGGLNIERFSDVDDVRADIEPWQGILHMLESSQMPPEDESELSHSERELLVDWIRQLLDGEAKRRANDPGPALVRRLNNAEYDYTIGALTGVDLRPSEHFPAGGAAGEGFLNATDALGISPDLMSKYLDAANTIAAHVVLLPDDFRFSKSKFREDWVNELLDEMLALYGKYSTKLGEIPLNRYLAATTEHRQELRDGKTSIIEVAESQGLSPKYQQLIWDTLLSNEPSLLLDPVREGWNNGADIARLLNHISMWQNVVWQRQLPKGAQALDDRFLPAPVSLTDRHTYQLEMLDREPSEPAGEEEPPAVFYLAAQAFSGVADQNHVILQRPRFEIREPKDGAGNDRPLTLREAVEMNATASDDESAAPEDARRIELDRFGSHGQDETVGDTDLVLHGSEVLEVRLPRSVVAGRIFVVHAVADSNNSPEALLRFEVRRDPDPVQIHRGTEWQHRAAPANLPLLMVNPGQSSHDAIQKSIAEFRDVFPIRLCYPGIIVVDTTVTLERFHRGDRLLCDLMLSQKETARLDIFWEELHYISQDALQVRNSLATLVQGEIAAYEHVHQEVHRRADEIERILLESESRHIAQLLKLATRAYRRPLVEQEKQSLQDHYQALRQHELPHDEAFRSVLARILVSLNFLYRIEQPSPTKKTSPVNDWELASRLSYFLWSCMPDDHLRQLAANGRLSDPDILEQQTLRMLQDSRSRALAIEFGAQWLEVRKFDEFQGKSPEIFPTFDGQLRKAIYEETILLFTDMLKNGRPLTQLIDVDYTFLNDTLAAHYVIPDIEGPEFRRVNDVRQHGRGGMLGLASVLSKHSGASRTSPVLRGNFIAETLLGERLPRPPAEVPELPDGETGGDLTIRQLVEKHAQVKQCAVCHQRIDPLGFALEQFDTIGRSRDTDLAGRQIDTSAKLSSGEQFEGLEGLKHYLLTQRKDNFIRQFCRKLLGFALGRRILISDWQLLQNMSENLSKNNGSAADAVLAVVSSKQFRYIRGGRMTTDSIPHDE